MFICVWSQKLTNHRWARRPGESACNNDHKHKAGSSAQSWSLTSLPCVCVINSQQLSVQSDTVYGTTTRWVTVNPLSHTCWSMCPWEDRAPCVFHSIKDETRGRRTRKTMVFVEPDWSRSFKSVIKCFITSHINSSGQSLCIKLHAVLTQSWTLNHRRSHKNLKRQTNQPYTDLVWDQRSAGSDETRCVTLSCVIFSSAGLHKRSLRGESVLLWHDCAQLPACVQQTCAQPAWLWACCSFTHSLSNSQQGHAPADTVDSSIHTADVNYSLRLKERDTVTWSSTWLSHHSHSQCHWSFWGNFTNSSKPSTSPFLQDCWEKSCH